MENKDDNCPTIIGDTKHNLPKKFSLLQEKLIEQLCLQLSLGFLLLLANSSGYTPFVNKQLQADKITQPFQNITIKAIAITFQRIRHTCFQVIVLISMQFEKYSSSETL